MGYFFMDYWYLVLVLPMVILSGIAQFKVQSTFRKYSQRGTARGMSGREASQEIQRSSGISVRIEPVRGSLTDHYDPRTDVIRLSEPVCEARSVAAIGVAAHETGHAVQYAESYFPIKLRSAIVPVTQVASTLSPYLVIFGLLFSLEILAYVGVAFFAVAVVFQLVTLPVEFNASARAIRALKDGGMLTQDELAGVKKVLTAAAMTYVAALFVSLMSLLRLLLIVGRRGNNNR